MMFKVFKLLIVAVLVSCSDMSSSAEPPLAVVQRVKAVVEDVRYQLPVQIMYGIEMTDVKYDSNTSSLVYDCNYTVPLQPKRQLTIEAVKEIKHGIIHFLKANTDSDDKPALLRYLTK